MIFDEQVARKPDLYPFAKEAIKAMWAGHWTPEEFNFKSDVQDFKTELTEQERTVIVRALSAIGQIEISVKQFWGQLGSNLPHPSLSDLGFTMSSIEVIHNIAYEKLLDVLGLNDTFQENLQNSIIKGRVDYLKKYLKKCYKDSKKQYIYSLILFTLFVENVSLFSQFYIILWFGRFKNVLKDTNQQVLYTKNEELIHAQVGVQLINIIRKEYPELFDKELQDRVISEAKEAFKAESLIIDWMLNEYNGSRLNSDILKEYVKYRINESLTQIGFGSVWEIDNDLHRDFEWMNEELLGNNMTDFFYKRSVDYSKNTKTYNPEDLF